MQAVYANPGSISCGTLRLEDLIPTFISELETLVEELSLSVKTTDIALIQQQTVTDVARYHNIMGDIERRMKVDGYFESEDANWSLEELSECLSDFCPDNHYFGTNEGDGADFGFWPIVEK